MKLKKYLENIIKGGKRKEKEKKREMGKNDESLGFIYIVHGTRDSRVQCNITMETDSLGFHGVGARNPRLSGSMVFFEPKCKEPETLGFFGKKPAYFGNKFLDCGKLEISLIFFIFLVFLPMLVWL